MDLAVPFFGIVDGIQLFASLFGVGFNGSGSPIQAWLPGVGNQTRLDEPLN